MSRPAGAVRLAALHLRMGALNEMQYRANLWVQLLNSLLALGTGVVAIAVVYTHTQSLRGWSPAELVTVMGVHLIIGGVLKAVVQPNMNGLLRDVQEGTLDYTLTRPADSQLLVSLREFSLWNLVDVALGTGVLVWALARLPGDLGPGQAAGFLLALLCGTVTIYSIWLAATTLAFKVISVENLVTLLNGVYEAGRWPVSIYPGWLRGGLTFLIPLAFAVTVPAETITARVEWPWLAGAVLVAVTSAVGSRLVWRWGIRSYSGASA